MAPGLIIGAEPAATANDCGPSDPSGSVLMESLFSRRIEFHPARKPCSAFGKDGSGDFQLETLNPRAAPLRNGCFPGQANGKSPAVAASEIFDNGLDPEITLGITLRKIGAGLENLGNTCFLNSVLQCLTYTEPLVAYLQSGKHQISCRVAGFCALCAIQKHVSRALQATGRILAPKDLVSNLRCISRSFRNARQEDAHEYMVNLLESMHKCCLPSGVSSESPSAYEKSLVHRIFGGRLRSQVRCMQCNYCSNKFDPFLDLSLEIMKTESLHKALEHFTAAEQLDGGERQYQCQRCRQKVKALKQLTVYKAPYVLTVHLKRFAPHDPTKKIDKKVHFGARLDLTPFVSGPNEGELKYSLYGVLVHAGWSTHSGHYYCFVRMSNGMWYSLDDNRVFQVSERTVLEQKAYMLFYVRDRRNKASKLPPDFWKGGLGSNSVENESCLTSDQAPKEISQNGLSAKDINDLAASVAMPQRNASNAGSSKETLVRQAHAEKTNGPAIVDSAIKREPTLSDSLRDQNKIVLREALVEKHSGLAMVDCASKKEPLSESSLIAQTKAQLNQAPMEMICRSMIAESVSDVKSNGGFQPPTFIKANGGTSNPVNPLVSTDTKIDRCNGDGSSKNNVNLISVPSSFGGSQGPDTSNRMTNMTSQKVECIQNGSDDMDLVSKKTAESVKELVSTRKSNKKLVNYGAARMHHGFNFLLGASLTLQKKHKRNKKKNLYHEKLFDKNHVLADSGPSTSEVYNCISQQSTPQRKRLKSRAKSAKDTVGMIESDASNGSRLDRINGECKDTIGQSIIKINEQMQKSACSGAASNHFHASDSRSSKGGGKSLTETTLMGAPARGFDDPIVPRWDEGELSPSAKVLESGPTGSASIGYVLDEWDEEYDRGKRKKVRESQRIFGGKNPFQEIASKKAQLKKQKIDRFRAGDRPFRI